MASTPKLFFCTIAGFYLASLALLPWIWFPPFPWLHEHAQWSDVVFAVAALAWVIEKWQTHTWPRLRPRHIAIALYLGAAFLSLLFASPNKPLGTWKLLGMVELGLLAVITADIAGRPGMRRALVQVVALTSLVTAAAAFIGLLLFYSGIHTELIGTYGDLVVSPWYARVQAGTIQPNMLASFCIFAAAVIAQQQVALPRWLRRVMQPILGLTVLLTFSRSIVTFALAAAIRRANTRWQRIAVGGAAVAILVLFISLTVGNLSLDPTSPAQARWETNRSSSRWEALETSFQTLVAHPFWGIGVGQKPGKRFGGQFDAHCTPLNIAATLGLPALIAFVSVFLFAWRERERPTNIAIWSGLAGIALDGLVEDVEDFRHLWVLIGLAAIEPTPQTVTS